MQSFIKSIIDPLHTHVVCKVRDILNDGLHSSMQYYYNRLRFEKNWISKQSEHVAYAGMSSVSISAINKDHNKRSTDRSSRIKRMIKDNRWYFYDKDNAKASSFHFL